MRKTFARFSPLFIFVFFGIVFVPLSASNNKKNKIYKIKEWSYVPYTMRADTLKVDTSYINLPMRNLQQDYSVSSSYNGNVVSPILSRLYFNRIDKISDIFGMAYQPYVITPSDVHFFNTTVPYSWIGYQRGFKQYHEEHDLDFLFTANLSKRANLGISLKYLSGVGHYSTQEGKLFRGSGFASYDGRHYFIHTSVTWNRLSNYENGGILNDSDLTTKLKPEDIAVRMKGMSAYQYYSCFLNHGYKMTTTKSYKDTFERIDKYGNKEIVDTTIYEYIPVISFAHTFDLNNSIHRYVEQNPYQSFYNDVFRSSVRTRDSSNVLTINNTLSVTFEEEFNRLFRFGLLVYVRNENQRFANNIHRFDARDMGLLDVRDIKTFSFDPILFSDTLMRHVWHDNFFIGGSVYKHMGKWFHFDVSADICLAGYKIGQFDTRGHTDFKFYFGRNILYIDADANIRYKQPHFFYETYTSNHFRWYNDFSKQLSYSIDLQLRYPTKWIRPNVKISFENTNNYIYFNEQSLPTQKKGNTYVFSTNVSLDIVSPFVALENKVCYQYSSREIPLPDWVLYHNLYYYGTWFRALDIQIGVDMTYFTRYYAPLLIPALGQFRIQRQQKIGNYPFMNVYVNFYVRLLHLKFYVQYTHLNHLFMKSSSDYMSMPHYPMNPDIFRLGILWHFYK